MAEVLIGGFIEGLKPEPRLTVTQWAEQKRVLGSKGSAESGPYRVLRTPYGRKVMDAMSARSKVTKFIGMKGIQLAFTEFGFNIIGYYMDSAPGPIMYVMPTVETMERNVKQRIDPMIEDCEALRNKVGKKRSKDGGNTLKQKDGPGFVLILTGANSAAGLRSIAVRVLLLDEVDGYPGDVDGEGSPVVLAMNRQVTFGANKKTYMISTPTIADESIIEREFLLTGQEYYHVPCPHCVQLQVLVFEQLKWETGKYDDVHYECIHCQGKIYNQHKTWMLIEESPERPYGARWIAARPDLSRPEVLGVHLSSLYSPDGWLSWEDVARMWDEAENDEPKKKTFINTILGKTYKVKGIAPPWQMLYERAQRDGHERNLVWASVAFLTAGVDVQADRLEVEIVGWMKGRVSQQVDYRVLVGDTTKPEVWGELDVLLDETFEFDNSAIRQFDNGGIDVGGNVSVNVKNVDGRRIGIRLMGVDTGFNAGFVHDFARKHGTKRVIPIKGMEKLEMPYSNPKVNTKTKLGKNLPKGKVWPVGVSYLKEQLYGWLRLTMDDQVGEVPKGYCHFVALEEAYFRGITAEERVPVRNKKTNAIRYEWVKRYVRNEPLDCRVYATAAAYVLGFDRWTDKQWEKQLMNSAIRQFDNSAMADVAPIVDESNDMPVDTSLGAQLREEERKGKRKPKRGGYWDRS